MITNLRRNLRLACSLILLLLLWVCPVAAQNAIELVEIRTGNVGGVGYVDLVLTSLPEYKAFILTDPDRVVVDLYQVTLRGASRQVPLEDPHAKGARISQYAPDQVRLVIDLDCLVGYAVEGRDEGENQVLRITLSNDTGFVQYVAGASFQREEAHARLQVVTTGPVSAEVSSLKDPLRLVIDLYPAILIAPTKQIEVADEAVAGLRLSQYSRDVVRLVLDLNYPLAAVVREWDPVSGTLPIDLYYRLTSVTANLNGHGLEVVATCSGPVQFTYHLLKEPARFFVDLPGTVPMPNLERQFMPHSPITGVRIAEHLPGQTRLVFDLAYPIQPIVSQVEPTGFSVVFPTRPVLGRTISLDPGHGGHDPGATSATGSYEKDVVLAIARYLEQMLTAAGANVVLTRDDDFYPSWTSRIATSQQGVADIFISIHANGAISEQARGTETIYQTGRGDGKELATVVHQELVKAIGLPDRGIKARQNLIVLRNAEIPAILVEVAFITNPEEEKKLKDPEFQQQVALGLFMGINQYFALQAGTSYVHTVMPDLEPMTQPETKGKLEMKLEMKGPSSQWLRNKLLLLPQPELFWRVSKLPITQQERHFFILGPLGLPPVSVYLEGNVAEASGPNIPGMISLPSAELTEGTFTPEYLMYMID